MHPNLLQDSGEMLGDAGAVVGVKSGDQTAEADQGHHGVTASGQRHGTTDGLWSEDDHGVGIVHDETPGRERERGGHGWHLSHPPVDD